MTAIERPNNYEACKTCRLCANQVVTYSGVANVRGIYINCSVVGKNVHMQTAVHSNIDGDPKVREIHKLERSRGRVVHEAISVEHSPRMDVSKTCPGLKAGQELKTAKKKKWSPRKLWSR